LDQVIFPSISHLAGFFYHYLSYSLQHLSASVWHLFFYSSSSHYRRIHPFSVDPTFLSFFSFDSQNISQWIIYRKMGVDAPQQVTYRLLSSYRYFISACFLLAVPELQ
jgi:hypothetical protein